MSAMSCQLERLVNVSLYFQIQLRMSTEPIAEGLKHGKRNRSHLIHLQSQQIIGHQQHQTQVLKEQAATMAEFQSELRSVRAQNLVRSVLFPSISSGR